MERVKEINFIKQVERTSKRDAYQAAYSWGLSDNIDKATLMWFLKEKIEGHSEYLELMPLEYDYATQTLVPKRQLIESIK